MGYGWRRVTEAVRQKVVTDRSFKATSNARNEAMFKEATDFCAHIKILEKDLRGLHKEVEGNFTNLRGILMSPLPRAYEEGQGGVAVVCSEGDVKQIGHGINADALVVCAHQLKARVEEEVIKPLKSWYTAYRNIADRMDKLEQLRLEVDSRRRTVDALQAKLERLRNTQNSNNRDKLDQEIDKTMLMLQHKHDKLTRTANNYREQEQVVFNSLNTLVKDTGVLRDYAGHAMQLVQDCYMDAHGTFKTAVPMPEYNSTSETMFTQAPYGALPVMDKVKSERAMMVRNMSEQRPRMTKETEKSAAIYAADDATEIPVYDQQNSSPRHYGYDMPISSNPQHMQQSPQQQYMQPNPYGGGNPYQGAYSPSGRYMGQAPAAAW